MVVGYLEDLQHIWNREMLIQDSEGFLISTQHGAHGEVSEINTDINCKHLAAFKFNIMVFIIWNFEISILGELQAFFICIIFDQVDFFGVGEQ